MKKICTLIFIFTIMFAFSVAFATVEGTNKTIKLNRTVSDNLKSYDEIDYFSFVLSKPGSIKIDFDFDVLGQYLVKLVDTDTGKTLQSTTFSSAVNTVSGRYSKSANKIRLPKGEYQIAVSTSKLYFSKKGYEMEVNYEVESGDRYEKEPNNDAKTSMIIEAGEEVTGNLQSSSDVDYYMVEIARAGSLQVKFEFPYQSQYNAVLYSEDNGNLKQIQTTKFYTGINPNDDKTIQLSDKLRINAGNYYLKITSSGNKTYTDEDYTLTFEYESEKYGNYEKEVNDDAKSANEIFITESYTGNLNSSSDADYYTFEVTNTNNIYLTMQRPEGAEYNAILYKEYNGSLIQVKAVTVTDKSDKYISFDVERAMYYLKISSKKYSNSDYLFAILTPNEVHIEKTIVLEINNSNMKVDGVKVAIDGDRGTKPVVSDGRTLLPMRAIIENLGGSVAWNQNDSFAEFKLGSVMVQIPINSTTAYVNGAVKYLDAPAQTINDRTMLPVRFIMENLGGKITWDENNKTVTIVY